MKAVQCLVAALEDDPFYQTITAEYTHQPEKRRATLAAYFQYALEESEQYGFSVVPAESFGAAIWLMPQTAAASAAAQNAKHAFLAELLGATGYRSYQTILAFMEPRAEALVDEQAWYLSIAGICPAKQGQGLGTALLQPTLTRADEQHAQCYLETFTPRNESFYRRLGFEVCQSYLEPTTGQSYAIMVRDPLTRQA